MGLGASVVLGVLGLPPPTIGLGGLDAWWQSAGTALAWFGYYLIFEAWKGATLGKRVVNLEVVGEDGGKPGLASAAVRNLWILFGLVPIVGGLALVGAVVVVTVTIARDPEERGLHDRLSSTMVIRRS